MEINDGEHEDLFPVDSVKHAVGKLAQNGSPHISVDNLVLHRAQTNAVEEGIDPLHKGAAEGVPYAIAIVLSSNTPSLRGHAAGGFRAAGRIDHFRFHGSSIILMRKKTSRLPVGNFPGGGIFSSRFLHFSRG